jgi:hypothetical protein
LGKTALRARRASLQGGEKRNSAAETLTPTANCGCRVRRRPQHPGPGAHPSASIRTSPTGSTAVPSTPRRHAIRAPLTQRAGPREHGKRVERWRSRCAGARRLGAMKITSFNARAWRAQRLCTTAPSVNTTAPGENTTAPGMNTTAPSQNTTRAEAVHDLLWSGAHRHRARAGHVLAETSHAPTRRAPAQGQSRSCSELARTCAAPEQVMFWPQHSVLWLSAVMLQVRAGHAPDQSRSCSGSAR